MPLNARPLTRGILLFSTVLWLVLGVGLWAHLDSLPSPLPTAVVAVATVVEPSGKTVPWSGTSNRVRADQQDLLGEFSRVGAFLTTLGVRLKPIHFQIDYDNPRRYLLTSGRLELGREIVMARGQLLHAFLKVWVLQNASSRFSTPVFRQDVIADVLSSVESNGLRLGVPGEKREVSYHDINGAGFFQQVATFGKLCESDWKPNDLLRICDGIRASALPVVHEVSPFSVRRVVGEVIWKTIEPLNTFERLDFVRAWIVHLTENTSDGTPIGDEALIPSESSLLQWQEWAREEVRALLPDRVLDTWRRGGHWASRLRSSHAAALNALELTLQDNIKVDIVARFDGTERAAEFRRALFAPFKIPGFSSPRIAIVGVGERYQLWPGAVALSRNELRRIRSRALIWESCESPNVREIISFPVLTDRALVVRNCSASSEVIRYRSFLSYGAEGFSLDNPAVSYVQMHRPSLEFALERGWLRWKTLLADLFQARHVTSGADRKLGLYEASWNPQMRAFRVLGAVEAVEWFRPESRAPLERMTESR